MRGAKDSKVGVHAIESKVDRGSWRRELTTKGLFVSLSCGVVMIRGMINRIAKINKH